MRNARFANGTIVQPAQRRFAIPVKAAVCVGSLLAQAAFGAETPATQTAAGASSSAPASAPAPSAGLVNDWLRGQSEAWKAWDIGGQFRIRYEVKDNSGSVANRDFIRNANNNNDELLERVRYHLGYTPASWVTAYVEGRNTLEQWDKRLPSADLDRFNLRQAYLTLGDAKRFPVTAKIGRQELLYGEERFIGIGDWSNTGRTFDALKLRHTGEGYWVDAFGGRVVVPDDANFAVANDYDWFSAVYASTSKLLPWQETQIFLLSRNAGSGAPNANAPGVPNSPTSPRDVYTLGTRWTPLPNKFGGWDYSLEAAGQLGSVNQGGVRREQQSYAVFASSGYTWRKAWGTPRLGMGYEFGSGDNNPNDGKNQTFENLFGTNHRFYGAMDLFSQRNMQIPRFCASVKPLKNLNISSEYLLLWLSNTADSLYPESGSGRSGNGYGKHPGFDSYVGSELDVIATYTIKKFGDLQLGYGHFFVGDYIKQSAATSATTGGTLDANWIYTQARFNF